MTAYLCFFGRDSSDVALIRSSVKCLDKFFLPILQTFPPVSVKRQRCETIATLPSTSGRLI